MLVPHDNERVRSFQVSARSIRNALSGVAIFALLLGTIAFMGSLAFGVQRYFEYQIEEARKISQPEDD